MDHGESLSGSVFHGETSLSFTDEKGAALILPYKARPEDPVNSWPFKSHMLNNYRNWTDLPRRPANLRREHVLSSSLAVT